MSRVEIFTVEYQLHGETKSFVIRASQMSNALAWHWASCDAGVAQIPKFGQRNLKQVSKPMAEKYGITDVRWCVSSALNWSEGLTQ